MEIDDALEIRVRLRQQDGTYQETWMPVTSLVSTSFASSSEVASSSAKAAVSLLQSWIDGDADEQRETGAYLIQALNEDRLSDRKLFS